MHVAKGRNPRNRDPTTIWPKMDEEDGELRHQIGGVIGKQMSTFLLNLFASFTVADILVRDAEYRDTFKCFMCTHESSRQSMLVARFPLALLLHFFLAATLSARAAAVLVRSRGDYFTSLLSR